MRGERGGTRVQTKGGDNRRKERRLHWSMK